MKKITMAIALLMLGWLAPSLSFGRTINVNASGTSVNREIAGGFWRHNGAGYVVTSLRGVAGGLSADCFDWKANTGVAGQGGIGRTLDYLRYTRDRQTGMLMTVNMRGRGSLNSDGEFMYTDKTLSPLVNLAQDWVRYINYTVLTYRQGDTIPVGRDYDVVNGGSGGSVNPISWTPYLLSTDEPPVSKATYWEVGNEPEVQVNAANNFLGGTAETATTFDYHNRYKQITEAMSAEEIATGQPVKIGPCIVLVDPSQTNHVARSVFRDSNCRLDFVACHPYDDLGYASYWNNIPVMESQLRSVKSLQAAACSYVRNTLSADGRNPSAVELIISEWNPMGWDKTFHTYNQNQSQYQALACAESIFTFAEQGLRSAYFWGHMASTTGYGHPEEVTCFWPVYRLFEGFKAYLGDRRLDSYSDGYNFRVYTTRYTARNLIVVWGINFSNSNSVSLQLTLQNLNLTGKTVTLKTLGRLDGTVTQLTDKNDNVTPNRIGWRSEPIVGFNPANYTLTVPPASIRLLIIGPKVKNDFDGDGCSDLVLFRPGEGTWCVRYSGTNFLDSVVGNSNYAYGDVTTTPIAGDANGDRLADLINWQSGVWNLDYNIPDTMTDQSIELGTFGYIPIIGDFDGDGKSDVGVFRREAAGSGWYIRTSTTNFTSWLLRPDGTFPRWSTTNPRDVPLIGDYDGDGKDDLAVYRPDPDGSYWYILTSSSGFQNTLTVDGNFPRYGSSNFEDQPLTGDFDGDGRTDIVVYRPDSNGSYWYVLTSTSGFRSTLSPVLRWGEADFGDMPILGDFDGDGRTDPAVCRPGTSYRWSIRCSSTQATLVRTFGVRDDKIVGAPSMSGHGAVYDFNSLSGGLSGQDNWGSSTGAITITNGVAKVTGTPAKFSRTNDTIWSFPVFTGNETQAVIQMDTQRMALGSATSNMQFMLNTTMGTGGGPSIMLQNNTAGDASLGVRQARSGIWSTAPIPTDVAVGDWVRLKLVMDLTANNGRGLGSLHYRNLTKGTAFAPVAGLQNVDLYLNKVASPPANWNQLYLRSDGIAGYPVDNLTVRADEQGSVTGTVTPGTYSGNPQNAAVTVELRQDGAVVWVQRLLLDSAGRFTLGNIPAGLYDVAIKSYAHLRKVLPGVQVENTSTVLTPVTLISGDCDGNNKVNSTDLSIILDNMDRKSE